MEPIIYFFGSLPGGFSSFPQDHTKTIFQEFIKKSRNTLQIVVHRKENLLHYGYVRKFNNNFFGVCICVDRVINDVKTLFLFIDSIYADMITKGNILKMSSNTNIEWNIKNFTSESVAINEYKKQIIDNLNISDANSQELPPADFSISINDCMEISLEASQERIIDVTKRYPNIYIAKTEEEIAKITSFINLIKHKDKEIEKLNQKNSELTSQLTKEKIQQKNFKWVSVLGIIIFILGVVVWNKVLFPSEVTKYQTGDFLYYGPIQNNKPHGEGVAFYPKNDKLGRRYYIGHFVDGERQDTAAMLYYQSGDYYYGSMNGDNFSYGIHFSNSNNSYFEGSFKNNKPFSGIWYIRKESNLLENGKTKEVIFWKEDSRERIKN